MCLHRGTGLTRGTGALIFPLWVVPDQPVGQRKKPARKSTSAATAGSPARIGCVVCSSARPSQTARYSLWKRCRQNHLDTPKGPHLGAINRTTTGHIPKPLPRDRGPAWRRRLHRRSAFETSTASASADSARLTVPARGHWGPLRLPGEKSHEPCSTHPRRPPRNRDWLLRCLSSGFGCLLS